MNFSPKGSTDSGLCKVCKINWPWPQCQGHSVNWKCRKFEHLLKLLLLVVKLWYLALSRNVTRPFRSIEVWVTFTQGQGHSVNIKSWKMKHLSLKFMGQISWNFCCRFSYCKARSKGKSKVVALTLNKGQGQMLKINICSYLQDY